MRKRLILIAIPLIFTAACATTKTDAKNSTAETSSEAVQQTTEATPVKAQKGSLQGHDSVTYRMPAQAGQVLEFHLKSDNPQLYANIYSPGDTPGQSQPLFNGPSSGTDGFIPLPLTGDYTFQIFQMRANADRNASADFELTTDFHQKGEASGPNFAKINSKNPVPLLATPDAAQPTVLLEGLVIKEECKPQGDTPFCKVKTADGHEGFVKEAFLEELNAPAAQPAAATAQQAPAQPAADQNAAPAAPAKQ